jgi:hypothetical protein
MAKFRGANGEFTAETFLVNFRLINGVQFTGVPVTRGDRSPGVHAPKGVDIIRFGTSQ